MDSLVIYSVVSKSKEYRALDEPEEINDLRTHKHGHGRGEEDCAPEATKRKRWISIYVLCFLTFLICSKAIGQLNRLKLLVIGANIFTAVFSIIMTSIWPYLLEVDNKNASAKFLGWVIAVFSFGQLVGSPLFGFWGDKRPAREPLIVALLVNVIFNVLYSYCGAFPSGLAGWIMLVSRTMVGFTTGTAAVVRAYVSEATTEKERTGALAVFTSAQGLGYILGPALGLIFVPLGTEGLSIEAIKFRLNMYTGPGYLNALLGVVAIILLVFVFQESKLIQSKISRLNIIPTKLKLLSAMKLSAGCLCCPFLSKSITSIAKTESQSSPSKKPFDMLAALAVIIIFFVTFFVLSAFESLGLTLTMDEFAWTKKQAVLYNNILWLGLSIISILTYIVVKFIAKKIDERKILLIALFIIAFAYFGMLPMTNEPPKVASTGPLSSDRTSNNSESWLPEASANETLEIVGCRDPPQTWCSQVGRIFLPQYIVALIFFAVGFSAANLTNLTVFSKILGPFPQGTMMGVLTSAGSLARGMGPLLITLLYQHKGPAIAIATVVGIVGASIIFFLIYYRRLVPYRPGSGYKAIT